LVKVKNVEIGWSEIWKISYNLIDSVPGWFVTLYKREYCIFAAWMNC